MAARTAPVAARDISAELAFLTRALKAPTLRTSAVSQLRTSNGSTIRRPGGGANAAASVA
jgi:hypothetical protein